jgi:excinuclease ABC subunit B
MLKEMGFVEGIENYTRYFENLKPGEAASTLMDYFPKEYICFIDESHITLPQIGGMFGGNMSRKLNLVNYGFRLPSSYDNRPLKFDEFLERVNKGVFVSATPGPFENENSQNVVDLVVRPTGLLDPQIVMRPVDGQVDDLISEIRETNKKGERVLVTTLTKKTSESLTEYLKELGVKVAYLHSDIETLERSEILNDLRLGKYDVVVGINLLREGLDLPEVSLVAILDADKEGFLRSRTSLIQTIGRAARNVNGRVIMYANRVTDSMQAAIDETERRRERQMEYNKEHGITPTQIIKKIHELDESMRSKKGKKSDSGAKLTTSRINKEEVKKLIKELEDKMWMASQNFDFETAIELREQIEELQDKV